MGGVRPLFDHKKHTNVKFKFASRFIKRNEDAVRADSLTKMLEVNSVNDFWKEIKRINSVKTSLPAKTGGVSGSEEVTRTRHYCDLFNCVKSSIFAWMKLIIRKML